MIILDTNVISEPLRMNAELRVRTWLDEQAAETLFLTATSLSELLLGIEMLPQGKRRDGLGADLRTLLDRLFGPRILPFDDKAATLYAPLVARARSKGKVISVGDGQIAAVAALHRFKVATRDTTPFIAAEVPVIDPWSLA
jgi:toxin FitB